jgi:PleD family two-component response regulator
MSNWKPYLVQSNGPVEVEKTMTSKILCLFDCQKAQTGLGDLLGSAYETECVPTILAALQSLKRSKPAAIVAQLHLREESCFDFLRALENNPEYASIPVITCCVEDVNKSIEEYLIKVSAFLGSKIYVRSQDFYSARLQREVAQCIKDSQRKILAMSHVETA